MKPFAAELNNHHPIIAENGSVVISKPNYFPFLETTTTYFGCDYLQIINALKILRSKFNFVITPFNRYMAKRRICTGSVHTNQTKQKRYA